MIEPTILMITYLKLLPQTIKFTTIIFFSVLDIFKNFFLFIFSYRFVICGIYIYNK